MFLQRLKDKFKQKSAEKFIKSELQRIPEIEHKGSQIKKIGVILDLDNFEQFERFYQFIDLFKLTPNAVKIIGYRAFYDKNSPYATPVFSDKDLGWGGAIENSYALEFLTKEYDLLLNYYKNDALILKLMTVKSKARIKVGFSELGTDLNDLILQSSIADFDTFKGELQKYLKVMNEL